jgi:hypothetical protein
MVLVFGAGAVLGYLVAAQGPARNPDRVEARPEGSMRIASELARPPLDQSVSREASSSNPSMDLESEIRAAIHEPDLHRRNHRVFELVSSLDAENAVRALEIASKLPAVHQDAIQPIIIGRWLELDPSAALAWVAAIPPGPRGRLITNATLSSLAARDPKLGLEFLQSIPEPGAGQASYRREFFRAWARIDPKTAAEYGFRTEPPAGRTLLVNDCLLAWAEREPHGAMEWARQLPEEQRSSGFRTVLQAWSGNDPVGASNAALSVSDERERDLALGNVIMGACRHDSKLAIDLLGKISGDSAYSEATGTLLGTLVSTDIASAGELFLKMPPVQQGMYLGNVARAYAQNDVRGALAWASRLGTDEHEKRAIPVIVTTWAGSNPDEAFQYANSGGLAELLPQILGKWATTDPHAAIAKAESLPAGKARDDALHECLVSLSLKAPEDAIRRAGALSGESRQEALSRVTEIWSFSDPQAAANHVITWADADAVDAIPNVMQNWARKTPVRAGEWLQQLPPGPTRDHAVYSFTTVVRGTAPGTAAEWTLAIRDPQVQEKAIRELIQGWKGHDGKSALRWLRETPGIPEQLRQSLLVPSAAE